MTIIERTVVVEESTRIDAPPERVWEVFSRVERWPEWNPACRQAKYLSGRPWKVDSVFEFTVKPWWREVSFKPTVVASAPPQRVVWLGKADGIYGQHTFSFDPEGDGTRATSHEVFSGPMLWAMPLLSPSGKVKEMFARWLQALKVEVEKGGR